jgi:hypothetical protein
MGGRKMKKRILVRLMTVSLCLSLIVLGFGKKVCAMTVLETNVSTASSECTILGVYGSYYSQAEDALERINEIRKEACEAGNVPDPRNPERMLTSSDYVPIKWSTDLESVAKIRAAEGGLAYSFMGSGHNRLNGKGTFSVSYNGISSYAEDLAYNFGTSMVSGINQWYGEKSSWVNQVSGAVTGHYTSMINPEYTYVGLGDFYTTESTYHNTLAGEFSTSTKTLDQTMQTAQKDVMQKIEVKIEYIVDYILEGMTAINTDETTTLTPRVELVNGSKTCTLWLVDAVTYSSSDTSVATVSEDGTVTGVKSGNVTITAKAGDVELATKEIAVKCGHDKKLKSETVATCTTTGLKEYECEICGETSEQEIPKLAHSYVFGEADSEGYRTGICSACEDSVQIKPPTAFGISWRNGAVSSSSYSTSFPSSNAVGSIIYCLPSVIDGDSGYQDMVIESTDESVIAAMETVTANSSNKLTVLSAGITTLTVYPKYNPSLKRTYVARVGDTGSVDISTVDVTLTQDTYEYSGKAVTPSVTVSYHDTVLKQNTDYTLTYENNSEVGTATVVITGKGIFTGVIRKEFNITHEEHTIATDSAVSATCTEPGLSSGSHCSVCGAVIVAQNVVEATGHNYINGVCQYCNDTINADADVENPTNPGTGESGTTVTPGTGESGTTVTPGTGDSETTVTPGKDDGEEQKVSDKNTTTDEDKINEDIVENDKNKPDEDDDDDSQVEDILDEEDYPEVGDIFAVKGLKYKVVTSYPEKKEFEVTCMGANSKNITKATIPAYVSYDEYDFKVVSIGKKAFFGCKKLKTVSIGKYVESVGVQAFFECTSMKKITIPSKVSKIGAQAFAKCKNLTQITIKSTLLKEKNVGKQAFTGINKKAVVKVPAKKKTAYKKWLKKKGLSKKQQKIK